MTDIMVKSIPGTVGLLRSDISGGMTGCYKRKQAQAVTFRCSESVDALCKGMSMLVLMRRKKNCNIFEEVTDIFGRPKPEPEKKTDSSDS